MMKLDTESGGAGGGGGGGEESTRAPLSKHGSKSVVSVRLKPLYLHSLR